MLREDQGRQYETRPYARVSDLPTSRRQDLSAGYRKVRAMDGGAIMKTGGHVSSKSDGEREVVDCCQPRGVDGSWTASRAVIVRCRTHA